MASRAVRFVSSLELAAEVVDLGLLLFDDGLKVIDARDALI